MIVGIIGGMGPEATSYLFRKLISLTNATNDQDHLHIIIDNNTEIPDRTEYILGKGDSPIVEMVRSAIKLEMMGADEILIPCNTAHFLYNDLIKFTKSKVIHMIYETIDFLKEYFPDNTKFLLLSTIGTYTSGIYKEIFEEKGLKITEPNKADKETIMKWIYNAKSGVYVKEDIFKSIIEKYTEKEKLPIVIGCTELSFLTESMNIPNKVDPVEIIAKNCIKRAKIYKNS